MNGRMLLMNLNSIQRSRIKWAYDNTVRLDFSRLASRWIVLLSSHSTVALETNIRM